MLTFESLAASGTILGTNEVRKKITRSNAPDAGSANVFYPSGSFLRLTALRRHVCSVVDIPCGSARLR